MPGRERKRVYADTGALVAYYCPEPTSAPVQERLLAAESVALSWLARTEFSSAVARRRRDGRLAAAAAAALFELLDRHAASGRFDVVPVTAEDHYAAATWMRSGAMAPRALDALHLAIASRCELTLLTTDPSLAASARDLRIDVDLVAPPETFQ